MSKPIRVQLYADAATAGSVLFGLADAFSIPGVTYSKLVAGEAGAPLFDVKFVAQDRRPFKGRSGVTITPDLTVNDTEPADLICIPNVAAPLDDPPHGRFADVVEWVQRQHRDGALIGSVCSGAIVLAEAGLLDDKEATTHWAYRGYFHRHFPKVKMRTGRTLVLAGKGNRIVTAGGLGSWQDLALYLIAHLVNTEEAVRTAKVYLFCDRQEGQLPFATMVRSIQHSDPLIQACQLWAADNYADQRPVARMMESTGLARQTFARRFKAATGYRPLEYIQSLRIEEAKQMLETSEDVIEKIALETGYHDPHSFRLLFKRFTGLTPGDYRRRFSHSRFGVRQEPT
jgi:transcriptional regulator GlxA family with amidase domain